MDQNLSIPILPTIKLRVRAGRVIDTDFVRHDEGGFGSPGNYHVSQIAVVHFYVALACAECEALYAVWQSVNDVIREREGGNGVGGNGKLLPSQTTSQN